MSKPTAAMCPCCSAPSRFSGSPDLQVHAAIRNPEPSSLNSCRALRRFRAVGVSTVRRRDQEIGIGPPVGAPHPAPELVELGQAEAVGPVDDDGVDVGDVEPVLDDGGGDQDVELPVAGSASMTVLELPFRHLAVGHADPGLGDELPEACRPWCRWSPPGCARRRPARPARVSRRMASAMTPVREGSDVGVDGQAVLGAGSR